MACARQSLSQGSKAFVIVSDTTCRHGTGEGVIPVNGAGDDYVPQHKKKQVWIASDVEKGKINYNSHHNVKLLFKC